MAAGPPRVLLSARTASHDCAGAYWFHAGTALADGRRQDPGVSVERMARGISTSQGAWPDAHGMDHRAGPTTRKSIDDSSRTQSHPRALRDQWHQDSQPDRRLLYAGAILESGRRQAEG